jgi:hypothetical protein
LLNKVSDLINPFTGAWDEELIRANFWAIGATRILEIPLAPSGMQDFVPWHYTKLGTFIVRSAYHLEWDYQFGRHHPDVMSVGNPEGSRVWKKLWRLNIPA